MKFIGWGGAIPRISGLSPVPLPGGSAVKCHHLGVFSSQISSVPLVHQRSPSLRGRVGVLDLAPLNAGKGALHERRHLC